MLVYECWVHDQPDSFNKFANLDDVADWLKQQDVRVGTNISIGAHDSSEYSFMSDHRRSISREVMANEG